MTGSAWFAGTLGFSAAVLATALQGSGFFAVFGVNPNLAFVAAAVGAYLTGRFVWGFGSALGTVTAALTFYPAFAGSAALAGVIMLGAAAFLARRKSAWSVFIIVIAAGTALFYLFKILFGGTPPPAAVFWGELVYNVLCGMFMTAVFKHERRTAS